MLHVLPLMTDLHVVTHAQCGALPAIEVSLSHRLHWLDVVLPQQLDIMGVTGKLVKSK